jgi:hypothetical protein
MEASNMPERDISHVEWVIANTINETARGDPDALAARILTALADAGYRIVPGDVIPIRPAPGTEDTAVGSQSFDELAPEMRPQDTYGDGRGPAS